MKLTKQQTTDVIEALANNWNDRIFNHYKQLVDSEATRPQDELSQEWLAMIDKLTKLTTTVVKN